MMCSFCGKNAEYMVTVHRLVPTTHTHEVLDKMTLGPTWAKAALCSKCLPFRRIQEITTYETKEIKRTKEIRG